MSGLEEAAYRERAGLVDDGGGRGDAAAAYYDYGNEDGGEEDVLDNSEMQQLNEEAERMKGLGNKHMASQEYTRAYNAYSAALQLSPVGPSSHVFLSNRAASLLSLKRYSAAAVDARRAVALAPTFGKAHARLGQALYFLKDYSGAVAAYEDAVKYEPDNAVTWTYLSKAKSKLARQREKEQRKALGEEVSVSAASKEDSTVGGGNSIATDPNASAAVVTGGLRSSSTRLLDVVGSEFKNSNAVASSPPTEVQTEPMAGRGGGSPPVAEEVTLAQQQQQQQQNGDVIVDGEDPDYEEAVRLQHRATNFLSHKQYRSAIEEYSAALFLVPDDAFLSPQLHIGRAHALNGLKRHESATNDARMAVGIDPQSSEAYSVLAKSLFYSKEYAGAVEAFEKSAKCLGPGESLSMFDEAYLQKARGALKEKEAIRGGDEETTPKKGKVIPKLKPPRFVPREELVTSTPNLPPMPKAWPQQSPHSPYAFRVGPEREIVFFSESMGIKLNRGPDGVVRVLSVTPVTPESPIAREGDIRVGDVIREAAGVDMRRPITNIMWGDTVALVKLAPRPIKIVVAKEESPHPPAVVEELAKTGESGSSSFTPMAAFNGEEKVEEGGQVSDGNNFPSPANGEEAVANSVAVVAEGEAGSSSSGDELQTASNDDGDTDKVSGAADGGETAKPLRKRVEPDDADDDEGLYEDFPCRYSDEVAEDDTAEQKNQTEESEVTPTAPQDDPNSNGREQTEKIPSETDSSVEGGAADAEELQRPVDVSSETKDEKPLAAEGAQLHMSGSQEEIKALEGEILFQASNDEDPSAAHHGYSNEWWLKSTSTRSLIESGPVTKLVHGKMIWQGDQYVPRTLALYRNPDVIIVLRTPKNAAEVRGLLNLPPDLDVVEKDGFLIAESVVDLNTCKMRLSQLTTPTSFASLESDARASSTISNLKRRTCFEIASPSETVLLSAVVPKDGDTTKDVSYTDNRAYVETSAWEVAITMALHRAHSSVYTELSEDSFGFETDQAWKHMIVRGSLHSHVIKGNIEMLERALEIALTPEETNSSKEPKKELTQAEKSRILDERDEFGLTALMYACTRRSSAAVSILVNAGADCTIPTPRDLKTPCHLTAQCLDEKSLSTILSATYPSRPDPNALCAAGRTPMYLAAVEGMAVGGGSDPVALGCCISALEAWGAQMFVSDEEGRLPLPHPIACNALQWKAAELDVLFSHINYFHPLTDESTDDGADSTSLSIGEIMHYPIHTAFVALRKKIKLVKADGFNHGFEQLEVANTLVGTLETLLKHGFDPNERLDHLELRNDGAADLNDLFGFTPLQVLALAALDSKEMSSARDDDEETNEVGKKDIKKRPISSATIDGITSCISRSADLLVRSGARISVSAPPTSRKKESVAKGPIKTPLRASRKLQKLNLGRGSSGDSNPEIEDEVSNIPSGSSLDRTALKIEDNESVLELFGGQDKLKEARAEWTAEKTVRDSKRIILHAEVPKEDARGDSNSCTICWKTFGTVTNRRHTCRVTKRYVCEECSSKRMVVNGVEHRISDGPFLLAQVEGEAAEEEDQRVYDEEREQRRERLKKEQAARRAAAAEHPKDEDEDTAKQELFGGALVRNMKTLLGVEDEEEEEDKLQSVTASLSATRDAFNERGERLNSLAEKTSALKDGARDFAAMAKELNKKQQSRGLFW